MHRRIVALGAEEQAASSLALAYSDREIVLMSDQPILDGWDLPNAKFRQATPMGARSLIRASDTVVPLSARWILEEDWSLLHTLPRAAEAIGANYVLPVQRAAGPSGVWQVKGARWRRPDVPMAGPTTDLSEVTDPHGCGLLYQSHVKTEGTVMAIGRRQGKSVSIGLFQVFEERYFRAVILQAAESIDDRNICNLSLAILAALDRDGFFTLNWVLTNDGPRLTSVRPEPRAAFRTFRRGGIDLLGPQGETTVLRSGLRLIAQPHYSSYRSLEG